MPWDTLCPWVGHPRARQEPRINLVVVDPTRAALASDGAAVDQIPQMTGHGALGQPCELGELPHGREASPGAISERYNALHRPSEPGLQQAVDDKGDGYEG